MEVQEEDLACGEEAQSKGHEALMEKKPSCHKLQPGCHYGATMPLGATISCPVILGERGIAGVKAGAGNYHPL